MGPSGHHPVLLVKVLVYGYAIGVRSSRKLARLLERDVVFRYLAANQQPDFRTISDFRKEHREAFEELYEEILLSCREAGLADLERVALDGRRVQGYNGQAMVDCESQVIVAQNAAGQSRGYSDGLLWLFVYLPRSGPPCDSCTPMRLQRSNVSASPR